MNSIRFQKMLRLGRPMAALPATAALASGDVDGAHTLAEKARILLGELTR